MNYTNKIGFKIDNCSFENNIKYLFDLIENLKEEQPIEIGLECYENLNAKTFNKNSEIINTFSEKLKIHTNKIVHLTLDAKLLNIKDRTEEKWIQVWEEQIEVVNKINPKYLVLHATSKESKIYSEEEQIENICKNFNILENVFVKGGFHIPLYVENTYEDLYFYEKLFEKAPKNMNFVLDIGHMKIHTKESHDKWILFLLKLINEGRKLHFHIHDNKGKEDSHLTISSINDDRTIFFVKLLLLMFRDSNFILESRENEINKVLSDINLFKNLFEEFKNIENVFYNK